MIQIGTRKRLIIDSFVIAAIIVVVVNIYLLTELIGSPIAQKSEAFKTASSKWQQYEQMQDQTSGYLIKSAETLTGIAKIGQQAKPEKVQPAESTPDNQVEGQKADIMPHLAGILQVAQTGESLRFVALMEGKRLCKNDKIMNFTIKNITAKGVLISQNGQTKFIPAPGVYFSLVGQQTPTGAESR